MRQQEIINPRVKNAIRLNLNIVVLFLSVILSQNGYAQKKFEISPEKYEVISSAWPYSTEKIIKLNEKTLGFEVWMDEVWGKEFSSLHGVGFCLFEEEENLAKAFETLRVLVKNIEVKKLSKKLIDHRFNIKSPRNLDNALMLSEPIILGNYAFFYFKSKKDKGLYVQKKNAEGKWVPECGVSIYGQLH